MANTLKVKAGGNGPVFMEGFARRELDENGQDIHVIRDEPVDVPDTRYYRRRLACGDLVKVEE